MVGQRQRLQAAYRKLKPKSADLIINQVDMLIEVLSQFQFKLPEISYDGLRPDWHHLAFEKILSADKIALINIILASDGHLSFGCAFSVRKCIEPYDWYMNAYLAKKRLGIWRTCDLGALTFWPVEERSFVKDWHFLLANVGAIVRFLETGEPNKNMAEVEIFHSHKAGQS
jgi:hypothetical protein